MQYSERGEGRGGIAMIKNFEFTGRVNFGEVEGMTPIKLVYGSDTAGSYLVASTQPLR